MNAKLITPVSGETNVKRRPKISILFPEGDMNFVDIKINGRQAVKNGNTMKGFTTIESFKIGKKIKWTLRQKTPLPQKDIFIDARSSPSCYTVEQRFFVKGAKITHRFMPEYKNWCLTKSGVYSCVGRPTRTRAELNNFVSEELINSCDEADFAIYDTGWRFVGCQDGKTILVGDDVDRVFDINSTNPRVERDMISVCSGEKTHHIPFGYVPTKIEEEWYQMDKYRENVIFRCGLHIHWDSSSFITRINPKPIQNTSNDMLWTSEDIGEKIEEIEIKSKNKVIINNHKLIHTLHPKIEEI